MSPSPINSQSTDTKNQFDQVQIKGWAKLPSSSQKDKDEPPQKKKIKKKKSQPIPFLSEYGRTEAANIFVGRLTQARSMAAARDGNQLNQERNHQQQGRNGGDETFPDLDERLKGFLDSASHFLD